MNKFLLLVGGTACSVLLALILSFTALIGLAAGWIANISLSNSFIFLGIIIIFFAVILRVYKIPHDTA